ncbi:3'-5' exonuclease [Flavobacteriaceae bacterium]|nr:3'-5' exonuclease [Flavobacteriaceae bacterium]MDA8948841.1 3'-5' exonuclease [Flavobacteriaceae bacterium]MDA9016313.1 3'-5' exonuclease [Flavobacteriaceae bacterium]MDA9572342.1 3'-5' exonuclease [Flavobacteriaceae bacterium]MDB3862584.1 3'-5' exonuclease [Flavobacteriaceae bacterium]
MKLKLTKPLCFFDLETTGTAISKDRIVEMAVLKLNPDGTQDKKKWRVNPEQPIPEEASNVHGITDDMVANEPTFKALSNEVYSFIQGCDLAGYNSDRFDIPLLVEELLRAEVPFDFKNIKTVDVQTIFHKMEARTLAAALKFYCSKELTDAHTAQADTQATHDVLLAQLDRYSELEPNIDFLNTFSTRRKTADFAGFIVYNKEGEMCFGFGKHKDKKVTDVLAQEPGYFGWILNADFPRYTKKILTEIRLQHLNTKS